MIPYGKHFLDEDDIQAVVEVLRHGWLTQGPMVSEFEKNIADQVDAKFAVAVSSATAALHLCCLALDVDSQSNVFTTANTFVASANCVLYVGGTPYFCDIDPNTLNMCSVDLAQKAKDVGRMDVVIPVHFAGAPCDMVAISAVASTFGAKIIEDASHALGGRYSTGEKIGSCLNSTLTVFSLHPVKGVTAGEGGVITTNDESLYRRLLMLRSHGICKGNFDLPGISRGDDSILNATEAFDNGELNPWYYEMQSLGYNYRITDIQCALANSQLKKLDKFIARRKQIAAKYDGLLANVARIKPGQIQSRTVSAHHIYVVEIDFVEAGISRKTLMERLGADGFGTQVHYIPVPLQPYYAELGHDIKDFPHADKYYRGALSLPLFYGLMDEQVEAVVASLKEILNG